MSKERCLHTNSTSEPGIKLSEYAGNGTPVCISEFLTGCTKPSKDVNKEMKPIQSFIDKIPVPVFFKNIEGKYSGCNRAFMTFIGASDSKLISQRTEDNHYPEITEKNCSKEQMLLKMPGSRVCESIIKKKNGEIKYALINNATITNSNGETYGLIGLISDITTNKLLKDTLNTKAGNEEVSRDEHFKELTNIKQVLFDENKKRRSIEKQLAQASRKLEEYVKKNAESNLAMKSMLEYQENYKKEIEDNFLSNIKHLIMPYIIKLKRNKIMSDELESLNMIESKLSELISPLANKLSSNHTALTPKEIQIADLVRDGKHDKDITEIMHISIDTVKTHRKNIRRKLGIYGNRSNLRSTLLSLTS